MHVFKAPPSDWLHQTTTCIMGCIIAIVVIAIVGMIIPLLLIAFNILIPPLMQIIMAVIWSIVYVIKSYECFWFRVFSQGWACDELVA